MALSISLTKERRVEWPVHVDFALDGGKSVRQTFTAVYLLLPKSERDQLMAEAGLDADAPLVRRVLVGWKGLVNDDTKEEIPFSEEVREALIEMDEVRFAIAQTYFKASSGGRRKN